MKRFSPQHVEHAARKFAASGTARHWQMFGTEVREAFLDAAVMNEIRMVDAVDSAQTFTAAEIVLVEVLCAERPRR